MKHPDKREILNSTARSLFSLIPYAGTALTELVFEYSGRVKQNRLNHFIDVLSEGFTKDSDVNLENIKTENFSDLFEAVIKRVLTTKSELKLKRFKDILLRELVTPSQDPEFVDVYLDLITKLSEDELLILYGHRHFNKNYTRELERRDEIRSVIEKEKGTYEFDKKISMAITPYPKKIRELENEQMRIIENLSKFESYRTSRNYSLSEDKYQFYLQRLYSQGLLIDSGIGRIGMEPFKMMSITEFGLEFMNFIKQSS